MTRDAGDRPGRPKSALPPAALATVILAALLAGALLGGLWTFGNEGVSVKGIEELVK